MPTTTSTATTATVATWSLTPTILTKESSRRSSRVSWTLPELTDRTESLTVVVRWLLGDVQWTGLHAIVVHRHTPDGCRSDWLRVSREELWASLWS